MFVQVSQTRWSLFLKIPALYFIYIKKGELLLKISVRNSTDINCRNERFCLLLKK